ncbi:hypothetical protein [Mariniluteicoccus flavus]
MSLTACGAGSPSTAAIVDGHRITTGEVTSATNAYNEVAGQLAQQQGQKARPLPESIILSTLMRGEASASVARNQGQNLDATADAMLDTDPELAPFAKDARVRPLFRALARTQVLTQGIGEDRVDAELGKVAHTINPRFGLTGLGQVASNPQTGEIQTTSNSLSQLAQGQG